MTRPIISILTLLISTAAFAALLTREARAENIILVATLLPSSEVPPIINADQFASGTVTVTMDFARDSGNNLAAATARFDVVMSNFPPDELVILAHIHEGGPAANGPIRVDTGISQAAPVTLVNGLGAFTRTDISVPPVLAAQIVDNPTGFYFNVHTIINPGGAMRGQLVRQTVPAAMPVPTLSQWGSVLMLLLLAAAGALFLFARIKMEAAVVECGALTLSPKIVDSRLLAKTTLFVEAAIGLMLVVLKSVVAPSDIVGALASGVVLAFIIHLFIVNARRGEKEETMNDER